MNVSLWFVLKERIYISVLVWVCVCICGWKAYDMWQLVGRCHQGGRELRGELLLPWRPHRVAHGRVAWSRNQLRERQLKNRNREKRKKEGKKLIHIYRTKQRAKASDGVAIPRSWHLHNANIQPTQKKDEIRNLFRYKCDKSSFGCSYAHFFIQALISLWMLHHSCLPRAHNLSLCCSQNNKSKKHYKLVWMFSDTVINFCIFKILTLFLTKYQIFHMISFFFFSFKVFVFGQKYPLILTSYWFFI